MFLHFFLCAQTKKTYESNVAAENGEQDCLYPVPRFRLRNGTAKRIKEALYEANPKLDMNSINICSIRGSNILGEHKVIFANSEDEVLEYSHTASFAKSRKKT